ncbi:MAG: energy-coupling factor transporter transmembrane protein EcfT [Clostridia bacterium]|nr:energy-coupling factor transporter transmembrane protein EcfT [Clostridia bacterium]
MFKDVALGQYYQASSFVHRLDPRFKILALIAYIVAIFLSENFYGLGMCALLLLLTIAFSKVPLGKVIKAVKGILFLLVFTAIIQLFFYKPNENAVVWVKWWVITITDQAVFFTLFLLLRLSLLVMVASMLTYTTTPVSLTDGLESLLTPLKVVRFPVHELALIMSIALRFIPTLMEETERIMNAQKARGADFESGGLMKRAKAVVPILIPLLISSFRRAEELGDAMDARCYAGSKVRTKYKKLTFSWRDLLAFFIMAALVTGVVLFNVYLGGVV